GFRGWRYLGRVERIEELLHSDIVDEIALCLPFAQMEQMNASATLGEEEGKIVRMPVDVLDHAIAAGRFEDLDGTPVYSIVSGPDRALALVVKRAVAVAVSGDAVL